MATHKKCITTVYQSPEETGLVSLSLLPKAPRVAQANSNYLSMSYKKWAVFSP